MLNRAQWTLPVLSPRVEDDMKECMHDVQPQTFWNTLFQSIESHSCHFQKWNIAKTHFDLNLLAWSKSGEHVLSMLSSLKVEKRRPRSVGHKFEVNSWKDLEEIQIVTQASALHNSIPPISVRGFVLLKDSFRQGLVSLGPIFPPVKKPHSWNNP